MMPRHFVRWSFDCLRATRQTLLLFASALWLVASSGCTSTLYPTYVKRDEKVPRDPPTEALHGGLVISSDGDLSGGCVSMFQPDLLKDFGSRAKPKVNRFLEDKGIVVRIDRDRASAFEQNRSSGRKFLDALGYKWVDPYGSAITADEAYVDKLNVSETMKRTAQTGKPRTVTFQQIYVFNKQGCGVLGVSCWSWPTVVVHTVVLDESGEPVFTAQATGRGDGAPFFLDRTPENFELGLDRALAALEQSEEQRY